MKRVCQSALVVSLILVLCPGTWGQSRGHASMGLRASSGGVGMVRMTGGIRAIHGTTGGVVVVGNPALVSFAPFFPGAFPVPGLGFDFAHLAAVTRNVKVSDVSVLTTAQRLALAQRFAQVSPFFIPFLTPGPEVVVVEQPPVALVQQPAVAEEAAVPVRTESPEPRAKAQPAPAPERVPDIGEFVLVRRDGSLVFATAFTSSGGMLIYLTPQGARCWLRRSDLDLDTTIRMNEEPATTLHLPA